MRSTSQLEQISSEVGPKRPLEPPFLVALDAGAAKVTLTAEGTPRDPIVEKMLSLVDGQLKPRKSSSTVTLAIEMTD